MDSSDFSVCYLCCWISSVVFVYVYNGRDSCVVSNQEFVFLYESLHLSVFFNWVYFVFNFWVISV